MRIGSLECYLRTRLVSVTGMPDNHAEEIFYLLREKHASLNIRWESDFDGYSNIVVTLLWQDTTRLAVEWVDKFLPEAYYRPILVAKNEPNGGM